MVERHVTLGCFTSSGKCKSLRRKKRQCHFAAEAQAARILVTFEEMQVEYEAHRDRRWRKL
jgi:hypothetical protein